MPHAALLGSSGHNVSGEFFWTLVKLQQGSSPLVSICRAFKRSCTGARVRLEQVPGLEYTAHGPSIILLPVLIDK